MTADARPLPSPFDGLDAHARALWPQVSSDDLEACGADLACVAEAVSQSTGLASSVARVLLQVPMLAADEAERWFG